MGQVVSQEKLGIREQLEKKVSKVVLDLKDLVDLLDPLGLLEQQAHKEEMARPVSLDQLEKVATKALLAQLDLLDPVEAQVGEC